MTQTVDRAAWLAGDVLLLAGLNDGGDDVTSAAAGDQSFEVAIRTLRLSTNGDESSYRTLLVSTFDAPVDTRTPTLTLGSGESAASVDGTELADLLTDPATLLREELGTLPSEKRSDALQLLWSAAAPSLERSRSFLLAQLLADIQQELRPTLPPILMSPDDPSAAHIGVPFELSPGKVWLEGWMHDRDGTAARLTLVAPEGGRAELLPNLFRFRRPDIDEYYGDKEGAQGRRHGFYRYAELDGPSFLSKGWLLELETKTGWVGQKPVGEMNRSLVEARDWILGSSRHELPGSDELMREHTHPAIAIVQDRLGREAAIEAVVQLGKPPSSPSVSVIVPLYRDLSFLEYQMADWARDSEMAGEDLIYVLDSPEQVGELDEQAHGLYSLYGIPFRIAIMKANAGFAAVNNRAAELARGNKLLLLNSDVVPSAPGWLAPMSAFYDGSPNIGALGPKLLYEDDSLQHAGLYFHRSPDAPVWENMHYFKGQHRRLPAANVARQVPAVTGACMMIGRGLYEEMGGLSHQYVQGGYEDSDLCLRLTEKGRENWYVPGAELYHLEDQSYPTDVRRRVTGYNMWLQTELWGDRIESLIEHQRVPER